MNNGKPNENNINKNIRNINGRINIENIREYLGIIN
jgi:hypothetical protein